ncbi:MAG: methyltransferase [Acidobacteriota bacterium]
MATKTLSKYLIRGRVPLGFLLAAICLIFATPSSATVLAGAALALTGLLWRAWASGHLRKNERLATSGPYSYTRNPLYFGSFLLGSGFSLACGRLPLVMLWVAFFLLVYWPVMRSEAAHIEQLFKADYPLYAQSVPLFWPRLRPWPAQHQTGFDWQLYLRYREYRALIGMVAVLAALVAKIYWLPTIN